MLILNPNAGKGSAKSKLFNIVDGFVKNGDEVCVYTTQYQGNGGELIKKHAHHFNLLVSCGGDGTLNEIVNAMMEMGIQIPFGYIPMGTTNDFATTLKIPKNVDKAVKNIINGTIFNSDVGKFNDAYFAYVAAFGIFTEVSYSTPQEYKNLLGRAAYFLEGLIQLTKIKTYPLKIEYDGGVIEDEYIFGSISNSKFIGGMQAYNTKHANLDDGEFEVLLVKCPQNPLDLQIIITALLKQELNDKFMTFFRTSHMLIHSVQDVAWTLDGESGGSLKEVEINIIPKALPIIIGKHK
ncbi:MAG: diacylglycerol kinase family lipid kinase [Erysipelotrichaceae bacterium]